MTNNKSSGGGEAIGALLAVALIVFVVVIAVMVVIALGSVFGSSVSFLNYCKAFTANVRFERVGT